MQSDHYGCFKGLPIYTVQHDIPEYSGLHMSVVFKKRVLSGILGCKRKDIALGWGKLQ
jgi:hypothetical protein